MIKENRNDEARLKTEAVFHVIRPDRGENDQKH